MNILLHACCGPCLTVALEKLLKVGNITVFYYNPNTYPQEEWQKRKENVELLIEKVSKEYGVKIGFLCPEYSPHPFIDIVQKKKLGNEKEGGSRCTECMKIRLSKTAEVASEKGFDAFTTSLTVSPHKNAKLINKIGSEFGDCLKVKFLECDFKKENGFYNSVLLSKKYELYRQNYCGCEFSMPDREALLTSNVVIKKGEPK